MPFPTSLDSHTRDTDRNDGKGKSPACGGLLFETVRQLTQVVESIAKSGPEQYADLSFLARRLCLADLGKLIKSCFQFLL
jgi:hypothetical protein